jgi:hypothetical protein
MNFRILQTLALTCVSLAFLAVSATAQTATTPKSTAGNKSRAIVYHLTFTPNGTSINFRNYTNAYYVADVPTASGGGTLILMQVVGGTRTYYTYEDFGGLFIAIKGNDRKGVMVGSKTTASTTTTTTAATATTTASGATQNITLYGIGDAKDKIDSENPAFPNSEMLIPKTLEGTAIFVDSQEDFPFAFAAGENVGTAGQLTLTARYDEGMSANSLQKNLTRNAVVSSIWDLLKGQNYVDGSAATTTTPTTVVR